MFVCTLGTLLVSLCKNACVTCGACTHRHYDASCFCVQDFTRCCNVDNVALGPQKNLLAVRTLRYACSLSLDKSVWRFHPKPCSCPPHRPLFNRIARHSQPRRLRHHEARFTRNPIIATLNAAKPRATFAAARFSFLLLSSSRAAR